MMRRHDTRGFTLVELLVVIAILALLMGLLLPAVKSVRESARRTQCGNNARQIGLACQAYAASHEALPPGGNPAPAGQYGVSWMVWILPQLEQAAIYDRLDLVGDKGEAATSGWVGNHSANAAVLKGVRIPILYCPSSDLPEFTRTGSSTNASDDQLISGSMFVGIAGARDDVTAQDKIPVGAPGYVATSGAFRSWLNLQSGGCQRLGPVPLADIRDGTSNTLLIGEVSNWLINPATGAKVDWRADCQHGFLMGNCCDGRGRMFNLTVLAHRINETSSLAFGAMGNCGPNQPLRSPPAGGAGVGFADGSTRFLGDGIDFQVLCNLANRKDRKVIGATDF